MTSWLCLLQQFEATCGGEVLPQNLCVIFLAGLEKPPKERSNLDQYKGS